MTNEEKDRKEYELALLLKDENDVAHVITLVGQFGGEGVSEPRAKRLALAYEIKKQNEAVFVYFTFKAFGDEIKNLEHELNNRAEVLRFLVIASPAPAEHISTQAMPQERGNRSPRPMRSAPSTAEPKTSATTYTSSGPLSNEALEKKIEEILK